MIEKKIKWIYSIDYHYYYSVLSWIKSHISFYIVSWKVSSKCSCCWIYKKEIKRPFYWYKNHTQLQYYFLYFQLDDEIKKTGKYYIEINDIIVLIQLKGDINDIGSK